MNNGVPSFGLDQGYFMVGSLGNFLKLTNGAHNIIPGKKRYVNMNCRYVSTNLRLNHLSLIQFMIIGGKTNR